MEIQQRQWTSVGGWERPLTGPCLKAHMVLVFGSTMLLKEAQHTQDIQKAYPDACIIGCSTAGEIFDTHVSDDTISMTAVRFDSTHLKEFSVPIEDAGDSLEIGKKKGQNPKDDSWNQASLGQLCLLRSSFRNNATKSRLEGRSD